MNRLPSGLVVFFSVVLLSSCALVPFGPPDAPATPDTSATPDTLYVDPGQKMVDRMEQIVEAVNDHDAAALKAMFSTRALEQATDIDEGLDYLLSLFPDGGLTSNWWVGPAAERQYKNGQLTEVLLVEYNVSAGGQDYSLFFADFTVNEIIDPNNVGLYALGVTPWPEDHHSWIVEAPSTDPFFIWAESIHADESDENGYPGVFVPGER
jgi:Domain of unknown function (DUF5104)